MSIMMNLGITSVILLFLSATIPFTDSFERSLKYDYNISLIMTQNKHWQYVESTPYKIMLKNGESIRVSLNISASQQLDMVEFRFYHPCTKRIGLTTGKLYTYVDGSPALPTIGKVPGLNQIYMANPTCPEYGTVITTIWDTNDTRHSGKTSYEYTYRGNEPLFIKTIELYITQSD